MLFVLGLYSSMVVDRRPSLFSPPKTSLRPFPSPTLVGYHRFWVSRGALVHVRATGS